MVVVRTRLGSHRTTRAKAAEIHALLIDACYERVSTETADVPDHRSEYFDNAALTLANYTHATLPAQAKTFAPATDPVRRGATVQTSSQSLLNLGNRQMPERAPAAKTPNIVHAHAVHEILPSACSLERPGEPDDNLTETSSASSVDEIVQARYEGGFDRGFKFPVRNPIYGTTLCQKGNEALRHSTDSAEALHDHHDPSSMGSEGRATVTNFGNTTPGVGYALSCTTAARKSSDTAEYSAGIESQPAIDGPYFYEDDSYLSWYTEAGHRPETVAHSSGQGSEAFDLSIVDPAYKDQRNALRAAFDGASSTISQPSFKIEQQSPPVARFHGDDIDFLTEMQQFVEGGNAMDDLSTQFGFIGSPRFGTPPDQIGTPGLVAIRNHAVAQARRFAQPITPRSYPRALTLGRMLQESSHAPPPDVHDGRGHFVVQSDVYSSQSLNPSAHIPADCCESASRAANVSSTNDILAAVARKPQISAGIGNGNNSSSLPLNKENLQLFEARQEQRMLVEEIEGASADLLCLQRLAARSRQLGTQFLPRPEFDNLEDFVAWAQRQTQKDAPLNEQEIDLAEEAASMDKGQHTRANPVTPVNKVHGEEAYGRMSSSLRRDGHLPGTLPPGPPPKFALPPLPKRSVVRFVEPVGSDHSHESISTDILTPPPRPINPLNLPRRMLSTAPLLSTPIHVPSCALRNTFPQLTLATSPSSSSAASLPVTPQAVRNLRRDLDSEIQEAQGIIRLRMISEPTLRAINARNSGDIGGSQPLAEEFVEEITGEDEAVFGNIGCTMQ